MKINEFGLLGPSWETSWRPVGGLLGPPGGLLGRKARLFGSWSPLWAPLGLLLEPSWGLLGLS
eukprot:286740-Pyramimonas_sp.AAC.1